jgi:hypothetical protein
LALPPPHKCGTISPCNAALARATGPISGTDIAISFRQGRRILPQIEAVLAALVWDGWGS